MKKERLNRAAIEHSNKPKYLFAVDKNTIKIRFRVDKKDDIKEIKALYGSLEFYNKQFEKRLEIELVDDLYAYYTTIIKMDDPRIFYVFLITLKSGKSYYFSEEGITDTYNFSFYYYSAFSLSYLNESDIVKNNESFNGHIFYQIFPERFNMGNKNKDTSYINRKWSSTDLKGSNNNCVQDTFIGGDLKGVIDKIDYLKELGVNTIYMTPICLSSSNHKYDVEDYFKIDPHFGDDDTLKELVDKAHKNNMNVVLDLVFNHSSNKNQLFLDVVKNGKKSRYFDYYFVHGKNVIADPLNYETFGNGVKNMPKLNSNNFSEMDYFVNVGKYFVEKFGIDGYRLDVANEVSHTFWENFKLNLRRIKKDIILIGECWNDATNFLSNNQFESVMNYPFLLAALKFYINNTLTPQQYAFNLNSLLSRYPDNNNLMMLNLLDSHDTTRFYNYVNGDVDLYLCAFLTLIVYPGWPMVYYGDEIFMEGGADPDNRRGMIWNSPNFKSDIHLLFKDILKLRNNVALKSGSSKIYAKKDLLYIERHSEHNHVIAIINHSRSKASIRIRKNHVVLFNGYSDSILRNNGFIVLSYKTRK